MQSYLQKHFSALALILVLGVLVGFRIQYRSNNAPNGYNATTWDAFGYYMYLPSTFIYKDYRDLKWVEKMDSSYHLTGGYFYQANRVEKTGSYTNKYLIGVACMQLPYFTAGHIAAKITGAPQDGFSTPYQYAIIIGAIIQVFFGLWLLRKILLRYFNDRVTGYVLLFMGLTSNLIQYTSIDGAMSHSYIFPLYALILWWTIKWHEKMHWKYALLIGATIGLATISRPTELVMLFIPLLWNTADKEKRKAKWKMVGQHKSHILFAIIGGLIAMSPQFIYWKFTTGSFVYDVGSKWYFLNPWFRVLFGPEKGWFLYTPVAIFMVFGIFFMGKAEYKRSVLTFCLLNIWIIIAWADWRYGASYSTRALVQSYPIFAIPMAAFFTKWIQNKWSILLPVTLLLLTVLNFYQIHYYNKGFLESFSPFLFK